MNIFKRAKEQKQLVEDGDLEGAKRKAQEYENYPSDKEVERPVRKSEGGRYHNIPDSIGTDEDGPPREKYMKKRTY